MVRLQKSPLSAVSHIWATSGKCITDNLEKDRVIPFDAQGRADIIGALQREGRMSFAFGLKAGALSIYYGSSRNSRFFNESTSGVYLSQSFTFRIIPADFGVDL